MRWLRIEASGPYHRRAAPAPTAGKRGKWNRTASKNDDGSFGPAAARRIALLYGSCATVDSACSINISAGAFTSAPHCTITVTNSDNTGYTEHMVIQSVTPTELKVWRGQYYQPYGTTMILHFVCAGV
ncbi:MAG TPA: hypothetical protein VKP30_20645 [Polyangiaceae bacterium]|nr:hypothetical protein [Polyangiaceae bacterium]